MIVSSGADLDALVTPGHLSSVSSIVSSGSKWPRLQSSLSRDTRKYRSSVFPALPTPFRTSRSTSASSTRTLERNTCIRVLNLKRRKLAAAAVALHRSLTTEDDICSKRVTTFAPPTRVGTPAPAYQTNLVPFSDTPVPTFSRTTRNCDSSTDRGSLPAGSNHSVSCPAPRRHLRRIAGRRPSRLRASWRPPGLPARRSLSACPKAARRETVGPVRCPAG